MRQAFPVWWTFSMGKPIQFVCRSELWINQPAFPSPSLFFFLSSFPILIPCSQYFFWIPPVFPEIVLGRKILFVSCDDEKKKQNISYHFIPFVGQPVWVWNIEKYDTKLDPMHHAHSHIIHNHNFTKKWKQHVSIIRWMHK